MQHVVDAGARLRGERHVGQVAFKEFRGRNNVEVLAAASDEAVRHTDTMPAPEEFLREMRSDEAGAAGDEVEGQVSSDRSEP